MKWDQFLRVAYPDNLAVEESRRNIVYRANRWVGLRFAYALYHLGISANSISIVRVLICFISLFLISMVIHGNTWLPVVGVLLLAWQINLDFVDGAVARVQGKSSDLGTKFDGLANASSRAVLLVLMGYLSGSTVMLLIAAFSAYVLITFKPDTVKLMDESSSSRRFGTVEWILKKLLYVPVMVVGLPVLIAFHSVFSLPITFFSYSITLLYFALAVLWVFICLQSTPNPSDR